MPGSGTTRTGTALTGLAVAMGIVLLAVGEGSSRATALAALAGFLLGALVIVRARGTALGTATASLLLPVAAVLALGALALSIADATLVVPASTPAVSIGRLVGHVGVSLAVGAATAGAIGTLEDGVGDGAVTHFWGTTVGTLVPISLWLVIVLGVGEISTISALIGVDVEAFLRLIVAPADPLVGAVTLWLGILALLETFRRALRAAPVVELTPRSTRESAVERVERIDSVVRTGRTVAIVLPIAVGGGVTAGLFADVFSLPPAVLALVDVTTRPGLRRATGIAVVCFGAFTLSVWTLRRLTGTVAGIVGRVGPSVLGGFVTIVVVTLGSPLVWTVIDVVPPAQRPLVRELLARHSPAVVVLAVAALSLFALGTLLATVALAGAIKVIPARASAGAIAAGGLALGALAVGFTRGRPLVVFGVVALSIVAWDASERGVVTRVELGTRPPSRLEVLQTIGTAAVTGVGLTLAWVLYSIVLPEVRASQGTLVGVLTAILAALALVFVLRG